MMKLYAAIFALAGLAIWSAAPAGAQAPSAVQILDDKFSQAATFLGPAQAVNPLGGTFRMWRLRSWVDKKTGEAIHQLYVDTGYRGHWRFWELASTDRTETLNVSSINRSVGSCLSSCSYDETVGVEISDQQLRARASTGLEIKLTAKSGDTLVLPINSVQIAAQLVAVDRYLGRATVVPSLQAQSDTLFSEGVSSPLRETAETTLEKARALLMADGFTLLSSSEKAVKTTALPFPLKPTHADCGRALGIPYLADRRAKSMVSYQVTASQGQLRVQVVPEATYQAGYGAPTKALTCKSTGGLEKALLERLISPAGSL